MRILAVKYPPTEKDERKTKYFVDCYKKKIEPGVMEEMKMVTLSEPDLDSMDRAKAGLCDQIRLLSKRNFLGVQRNPMQNRAKIG